MVAYQNGGWLSSGGILSWWHVDRVASCCGGRLSRGILSLVTYSGGGILSRGVLSPVAYCLWWQIMGVAYCLGA